MTNMTQVPVASPGDWIDAAYINTYLRDNFKAVWPYTTAGDIAIAASSASLARLAKGADGQVLTMQSGAPAWGEGLPPGVVMDYAGASIPTGWLNCDGAAVSRTTYAALYNAIGTTFGAGNGSTTFNLPDGRGRATIGVGTGSGLTSRTLGAAVGEETHALSTAELASHSHAQSAHGHTDTGHTHNIAHSHTYYHTKYNGNLLSVRGSSLGSVDWEAAEDTLSQSTSTSGGGASAIGTANPAISNTGSGTAHNVIQPSLALNKIIKI